MYDYAAGSTFTASQDEATAAAKAVHQYFHDGSDFNAGEVIEKAVAFTLVIAAKAC